MRLFPKHFPRLGNGWQLVAILAMGIALFLFGGPGWADDPPTPESLRWQLEPLDSGELLWTGELPPAEPRTLVPWEAEAVWTSAGDSATTRLLARTGRLLTEYRKNHALPLSTLGAPPGRGTVALRFHRIRDLTLRSTVEVQGPAADFKALLRESEKALEDLRVNWEWAANCGVRRPETEVLLTIGSLYVPMAANLGSGEELGRQWLQWFLPKAQAETATAIRLRARPDLWSPVDDPPLGRLRMREGRLEAGIQIGDVEHWQPIALAGLAGRFRPGDLALVKRLGFNVIDPEEPADELRRAAERWNLALAQDLPEGAPAQITAGWEAFDESREQALADAPWLLWEASAEALRARRK